jgi:hypothetical protein
MLYGLANWRQDLHEKTSPSLADEWNEKKIPISKTGHSCEHMELQEIH